MGPAAGCDHAAHGKYAKRHGQGPFHSQVLISFIEPPIQGVSSGNADLIGLIRDEILQNGPISFARFMEQALYHSRHGFYSGDRARLGRAGDFFTNVSVGPAFGQMLAIQFIEIWERLGEPESFTIVEQGAHGGEFASDVLGWIQNQHPKFFADVRYRIIEPAPLLERRQRKALGGFQRVEWASSLDELEPFRGIFFSNELLDAFPVHLLVHRHGQENLWTEKRVAWSRERFEFSEQPLTDGPLAEYAKRLPLLDAVFEAEAALGIAPWLRTLSDRLMQGVAIAIDYGFRRADRFSSERRSGSLQVRQQHRVLESPFVAVGEADITAHVDWDEVIEQANACGLTQLGLLDQNHFLTGILSGSQEFLENATPKIRRELQTLLHPEMMGRSFQVLLLNRGTPDPSGLAGLRFARSRLNP